ncbi:MAG: deoxyribonuclease IV [Actinobacteria bacterium]|nr:deoxyribonuclease IV [Actinomycetota bacterium]
MYFGYHVSTEGSPVSAIKRGVEAGCDSIQIFSGSPRRWGTPEISGEEALAFRKSRAESGIRFVALHSIYLVNLASPEDSIYKRSMSSIISALDKADELDAFAVVTHIGNHKGRGEEFGLERITAGINTCLEKSSEKSLLLLETTAGAGTSIGGSFEQFGKIFESTNRPERLGFCLDTCHIFAAGYDIRTPSGIDATLSDLDGFIGLERLKLLHINDAKSDLGSHADRHEHIGEGNISLEAFRYIVNHPALRELPAIAELPYENAGDFDDLAVLRSLEE